jgi:hypothetical protein
VTLNTNIHNQLAAAHERDLLEAADRARLAAQTRQRPSAHWALRWRGARHSAGLEPCRSAPTPTIATR